MVAEPSNGYAVIVPVLETDVDSIYSTQNYWSEACPPCSSGNEGKVDLVYFFNCAPSARLEDVVTKISMRTGMDKVFRAVRCEFADLDPEIDLYIREKAGIPPTDQGFLSGPNQMFFRLMETVGKEYEAGFQMEIDCVPVKAGWCDRFVEVVEESHDFWMMGSRYHGWSWLPIPIQNHINGNSIYRFSDPAFQSFVDEVWKPRAEEMVHWGYADLAYDCFPAYYENLNRGPLTRPDIRSEMARMFGRFCETSFIVNLGGAEDEEKLYGDFETLKKEFRDAWIIHGSWLAANVIPRLSDPEFELAEKQGADTDKPESDRQRPDHFVKFVWVSEESWMFGNRFSLCRNNGKIFVGALIDTERVDSIKLTVKADHDAEVLARKWSETVSSGFLIGGLLVKLGKKLGLARGLGLERFLQMIRESFSHVERATGLGAALQQIRIWFHQMKGRKLGRSLNQLEIDSRRIPRGGVCFEIRGMEKVDVKGEFVLTVEAAASKE